MSLFRKKQRLVFQSSFIANDALYTVSQKIPTVELFVSLSNLNRLSKFFFTTEKRMKFATKSYDITHLTLCMLLHYLGKLKIQIFCRYSADMEENANNLHLCTDFNSLTRVTIYAACIYMLTEYMKY